MLQPVATGKREKRGVGWVQMLTGWCPAPYENSIYTTTYFRSDQKKKNLSICPFLIWNLVSISTTKFSLPFQWSHYFEASPSRTVSQPQSEFSFARFCVSKRLICIASFFPSDRPRANNRSRLLRLLQVIIIIISEGHSYLTLTFALGEMSLSNPFGIRILLFLSDSFGIETTNTFIHFRSFL